LKIVKEQKTRHKTVQVLLPASLGVMEQVLQVVDGWAHWVRNCCYKNLA
jgi:hypothetical protein